MATQPTNLPVPSESPRDLKFNAGKIDEFVTSHGWTYTDRFGNKHYTVEGLRWVAQQAIAAFGYITLDSFEDGNTLTLPNQVLRLEATGEYYRWDGAFPKTVPAGSTPDSTGGIGDGAWVAVGAAAFGQSIAIVDSVKDLMAVGDKSANNVRHVTGYGPGTDFGGGEFYWNPLTPKSQHNGITIFSPTVPWDGSYIGLSAFLAGTGETDGSGSGCWIRMQISRDMLVSWGGVDISGNNVADSSVTAVINYANAVKRSVRFDSGATIKCGFTTIVQHYDKFNLNLQCSFVLENISGIKVYAENDVEFNTDHPSYAERVIFRLKNCTEVEFSGFNFNSAFTDYSTGGSDGTYRPQEWWMGFTTEGCSKITISKHRANAGKNFVFADCTNLSTDLRNIDIHILENKLKYFVNYCAISRSINLLEFSRNRVSFNGRKWHTYGEAVAPTTQTKNIIICENEFTDQIAQQSCITPGPYIESGLISNNYCRRNYGIFIENGSSSNIIIEGNTSIGTGERADTTHILLVSGVDDTPDDGTTHSNILIQGNMFQGGGYAVQEYNTDISLKTGFSIINNHMVDCKMPVITNKSFIGVNISGNYMHAPDDFPDLAIGGQYPVIDNNVLIGVRVRARNIGYSIISPKITNNIFRANGVMTNFAALIDYDSFSGLVAEGNNATAAVYTDFITSPSNAITVGFRRIGTTEGFGSNPSTLYAGKITSETGDFVANREPTASGVYAWVCVNKTTNTFSSIVLSA